MLEGGGVCFCGLWDVGGPGAKQGREGEQAGLPGQVVLLLVGEVQARQECRGSLGWRGPQGSSGPLGLPAEGLLHEGSLAGAATPVVPGLAGQCTRTPGFT